MAPTGREQTSQTLVLSSHSTGKSRVPALPGTNDMAPGKPSQNDEGHKQRRKVVALVFSFSCAIVALAGLVCAGRYFWKKQRHKKRQMSLSNWAGQSPFLDTEGEMENCKLVHQGDTRRVSFTSILPYPLSKESRSIGELQLIEVSSMGITFGKDGMGEPKPDQAADGSPPPGADQPPGQSKHAEGEEIAEAPAAEETAGCTQDERPKAAEDTMAGGAGQQPPQEVPAPAPTQTSDENQPSPPT
nr:uncharacterized protein LOC111860840 [Paramormyrops kingsleyae]